MTRSRLLQLSQSSTKAESQILAHAQTGDDIGFSCSVSVLRHSRKAHTNDAFLMEKLGEEIDVQRRDIIGEHDDPLSVAILHFADRAYHSWEALQ